MTLIMVYGSIVCVYIYIYKNIDVKVNVGPRTAQIMFLLYS